MERTWAIAGLDLHLALSATRPARSIERALRDAVVEGRLPAGVRLPSSRALAADLGVARNTVADVYAQLTAEGWLEARVGSGTRVAARPDLTASPSGAGVSSGLAFDLRGGIPDASAFPRADWAAVARHALADAGSDVLGYADPLGLPQLRDALGRYLARARGVVADPSAVVVAHGFGDLLHLVCRALAEGGARRVAVEEVGHAAHRRIIRSAGLDVVALPVDADGAVVDALGPFEAGDGRVDAVLVTAAHQFPTGVPLAPERRRALVGWAERTGGLVIEDDYDGEFRYDRRAIGALQALAPERVVYAGTASKALAPAVGLGWGVVPAALLPALADARRDDGVRPDSIAQLTLAVFIDDHRYDRTVRRMRNAYRRRRERVEAVVAERLRGCAVRGLDAGLHCILELPAGVAEAEVEAEAARRGLAVEGLGRFRFRAGEGGPGAGASDGATRLVPSETAALVIGFGAPPAHRFEEALDRLAASIEWAMVAPKTREMGR